MNIDSNVVYYFQNIIFNRELNSKNKKATFHSFSVVAILVLVILLKAVDTIGNCQRLAFTAGVSQHMHEITCER